MNTVLGNFDEKFKNVVILYDRLLGDGIRCYGSTFREGSHLVELNSLQLQG